MKMKAFIVLALFGLSMLSPVHAAAQSLYADVDPSDGPEIQIVDNRVVFSFADLKYREKNLVGPVDVTRIVFSIPPNWTLASGGEIELHYDVLLSGSDIESVSGGGDLAVSLNGIIIASFPLNETSSNVVRIQIPPEALVTTREDGRHLLTISLSAQLSCVYDARVIVTVKPTSFFDLVFEETSPELSLTRLPAPFYLESSFIPDGVYIVVPDKPETLELQAAMDVMAGLGAMVGGNYNIELISAGELTPQNLPTYHIIFVGMPDKFTLLSDVNFEVPVVNGQFENLPQASASDGVLQMGLSPWNPSKAILLVSGNSGEAVLKAGQAVSAGRILVYENPRLAYVSNVQLLSGTLPIVEDFSLKDLGYATKTLSGIGGSSQAYQFYVSREQMTTNEGYLDLMYYHSGLLDYSLSAFSVSLNDQIISSIAFSEETQQVTTLRVKFPPGILRFGENTLEIRASLLATPSCDESGLIDPWLTISDQSVFHLPAGTGEPLTKALLKDLKFFPDLFATHSDLGDTAFILPKDNPASWKIAGKLAYRLGETVNPFIASLSVAYADDVPQLMRDNYSLIVIGKASTLPFLLEINDALPAPFDFTTDTASERQMQIVYRIPQGVSVGYLELMASPFNSERTLMLVAGNSDDGLVFAGNALLVNELQNQLAGVFAVTNGVQVATGKASAPFSIVGSGVPGSELIVATPISSNTGQQNLVEPPSWLLSVFIASGIITLFVIAFVVKGAIDKNKLNRLTLANPDDEPAAVEDSGKVE
ncbi:MAG: cellulose biosynthesis cyclic di-GMP-binding regulatory protein BcsB [Chloroflexi bacterium]|nr:cellulose biosynthesis cyclic di-GMP-binding regulatory protein BcsB [Chloroflexota bacterium]